MLDYSLLRLILTDILEKLQPFKVVQDVQKDAIKELFLEASVSDMILPPKGKRWELLSGIIIHAAGAQDSQIWATNTRTGRVYFMFSVASASAAGYYPIDLRGSRVIIEQADAFRMFVGNSGSYTVLRVVETDV